MVFNWVIQLVFRANSNVFSDAGTSLQPKALSRLILQKGLMSRLDSLRVRQQVGDEVAPHVAEAGVRQVPRDDHVSPVTLTQGVGGVKGLAIRG